MQEIFTPMFFLALALAGLCGYLLGSVNTAIILSRTVYKKDVRQLGSGNAGTTNVLRNFGRLGGALTLAGDILKGILGVLVGRYLFLWLAGGLSPLYGAYFAAVCTILGHMFPLYFGFKGGKGVATAGGVIIALQPLLALILLTVFLLVFYASKMVSLGSIVGMSLYPVLTAVYYLLTGAGPLWFCTLFSALIGGLVVWMHRENIKRIRAGTEYKFGKTKKDA